MVEFLFPVIKENLIDLKKSVFKLLKVVFILPKLRCLYMMFYSKQLMHKERIL